jgi:hypothetical protein
LDVELHGEEAYGSGEGAILVLPATRPAAPLAESVGITAAAEAGS